MMIRESRNTLYEIVDAELKKDGAHRPGPSEVAWIMNHIADGTISTVKELAEYGFSIQEKEAPPMRWKGNHDPLLEGYMGMYLISISFQEHPQDKDNHYTWEVYHMRQIGVKAQGTTDTLEEAIANAKAKVLALDADE
jgi:hypothetical protein